MQEMGLQLVLQQIQDALNENDIPRAEHLLWPALDQFPYMPQTWTSAGHIFYLSGRYFPAITCFEKALNLEPNPAVMANMGAALRRVNRIEDARTILNRSVEYDPENGASWSNLAATYVNEAEPDKGVELCDEALKWSPGHQQASWNKTLMNLERGHFAEGFSTYHIGLGDKRPEKYYGPNCVWLDAANFEEAKGSTVIVYGEQGIGDELMYASCLFDLAKDFNVIYDCHARLIEIFRANLPPNVTLYPTRKTKDPEWYNDEPYKISIGDVPQFYRSRRRLFRNAWQKYGPFYDNPVSEAEIESYRTGLEATADGRKIIGLATRGGVMSTNRTYRQIRPDTLDRLLGDDNLMFVSLDYEHVDLQCEEINKKYGEDKIYNFPSITHHFDYQHTQALVMACDAVVTVCQSVAHLSAASGQHTLVLAPRKCAWRYGLKGKEWYWYPGAKTRLFRQTQDDDWSKPIEQLWQHLTAKVKGGNNV